MDNPAAKKPIPRSRPKMRLIQNENAVEYGAKIKNFEPTTMFQRNLCSQYEVFTVFLQKASFDGLVRSRGHLELLCTMRTLPVPLPSDVTSTMESQGHVASM